MASGIVLISEAQYLKDMHAAITAVLPRRGRVYWRTEEENEDIAVTQDVETAAEILVAGGLGRSQALTLCHTLRSLNIGGDHRFVWNQLEDVDDIASELTDERLDLPITTFARSLRVTHDTLSRRVASLDHSPGPTEIVSHLIDPLLQERIAELQLASLFLAARWMSRWQYTADIREVALGLCAFHPDHTIQERSESMRRLFGPAVAGGSRVADVAVPAADPAATAQTKSVSEAALRSAASNGGRGEGTGALPSNASPPSDDEPVSSR
jgi:hypothetical protein